MKFVKFLILAFVAIFILVMASQFWGYWSGISYFDIASSLPLAAFHLFILGMMCYVFYLMYKYKV